MKFNNKDDVGSCKGAYPESLIKIRHDLRREHKLGAWMMLRVPGWSLEGWGHLELNIKYDVCGC